MFNWFKKKEKGIVERIQDLVEQQLHWEDKMVHGELREETCHNKISNDDVVECENCKAMVRKGNQETRQNLMHHSYIDSNDLITWVPYTADDAAYKSQWELETMHFCQKCAPEDTLLNDKKPVKEIVTTEKQPEGKHTCDQCDFTTDSQKGLSIHKGVKHK